VSRFRANGDNRKARITSIEAGLIVLVVSTSLAIASISLWWVPVYLALLVIILVTPGRRRVPSSSSESGADSHFAGIANLDVSLQVDRESGVDELHSSNEREIDLTSIEPTEEVGSDAGATSARAVKRRARVRARKPNVPASESLTDSLPVLWMQVGPGKFIRVEGATQSAGSAQTEEVRAHELPAFETPTAAPSAESAQAEPLADLQLVTPSEVSPDGIEAIAVFNDRICGSATEDYGIAPSTYSLNAEYDSSFKTVVDDLSGEPDPPEVNTASAVEPHDSCSPKPADAGRGLRQPGVSRRWMSRALRETIRTVSYAGRTSTRLIIQTSPRLRDLDRSAYVRKSSRRNAACRAFGRTLRIQHSLRTRSPPRS
jgi:hypothetical protein